jgi:hypothetical protein
LYRTLLRKDGIKSYRMERMENGKYKFNSFRYREVEDMVINNMNNGKSTGPGSINLKRIKYGGRNVLAFGNKIIN